MGRRYERCHEFYPIWRDHGKGAVLAVYFRLLSQNFYRSNGSYVRDLN
jgi:hypothetical protein